MKRTILVPLDGSEQAETVLPHAVAAARATNSTLTLLQVVASSSMLEMTVWPAGIPAGSMLDSAEERRIGYAYLQTTASKLHDSGVEFATQVLEGDPATEIVRYARDTGIRLIVMGTHGRTGVERLLMGSVAEKVMREAPCSVLVVKLPKGVPVPEPHQVAVASSPA